MARMRAAKQALRDILKSANWRSHLGEIAQGGMTQVGPLFSFLLLEPLLMHRAAVALGATCAVLAQKEPERARNVVRRYMWHLSEESGNIGWGIPEAFGETLAASSILAKDFHRVLITYVIDLGHSDNYCDNDLLRRSCYWACGRFAEVRPELCLNYRPWLAKGLLDRDIVCRGMAAWALCRLPGDLMDVPLLRDLALGRHNEPCLLFDGEVVYERAVSAIARDVLLTHPRCSKTEAPSECEAL
ncbi:MAG: HEAT repeat domain-containing protein [Desulfovibrio sp.]|nr:HEAT repeat domain-containing protein [Desulfovibrio sp.]